MDNGVNMAVLAEWLAGYGGRYRNILMVHCGVGIRTGMVSDGVLLRALNDDKDAFGHMVIAPNGKTCTCGNRGCLETIASMKAITVQMDEAMVSEAAVIFGIGLSNLMRILNPGLVILTGPLIRKFPLFYDICTRTADDSLAWPPNTVTYLKEGLFAEKAISLGAAAYAYGQRLTKGCIGFSGMRHHFER